MNIYEILLATNKLLLTAAIWQSVDGFVFPIFFFCFIFIFLSFFIGSVMHALDTSLLSKSSKRYMCSQSDESRPVT